LPSGDRERIQRIQRGLSEAGLDAIVCSLPANVLLLTGYWPVVGSSIAVATRDGRIAVLAPEDEAGLAQQGWADLHLFRPSSLERVTEALEQAREPLREIFHKAGLQHARIGYEGGMSEPATYVGMMIYGAGLSALLEQIVPAATKSIATGVLGQLRAVKTPREIECIRRSCAIAARAFDRGAREVGAGIRESELAELMHAELSVRGIEAASRAGGFVFCMSGPNSAQAYGAYARSRSRRIVPGDLALVHCNSYADGYWTDITRTYSIGEVDSRIADMREAVLSARAAALQAIAPGVKASEVDRAARRVLEQRGFGAEFKHSTGHGVGFAAIDHAARPRLHPNSPDVLETGMVFNIEPAVYLENFGGIRHCDMVAITPAGLDLLTGLEGDPASCPCVHTQRARLFA
jgi:Xaa-Pro aminopeptidase